MLKRELLVVSFARVVLTVVQTLVVFFGYQFLVDPVRIEPSCWRVNFVGNIFGDDELSLVVPVSSRFVLITAGVLQ
jgi:hypothetical protein